MKATAMVEGKEEWRRSRRSEVRKREKEEDSRKKR